jgi:hypothetical protein
MSDELREYLDELRENWRDAYWWADHTFLRTLLVCGLAGMIGLMFKAAELHIEGRMRPQP